MSSDVCEKRSKEQQKAWGILPGSYAYMAPEVLQLQQCTESVDIFSLGTVLWELVTGESPQRGKNRPVR